MIITGRSLWRIPVYLAPPVPHDPRLAPLEFMRLYDPEKITLPRNFLPRHPFDNGDLYTRDEKLAAHPRAPAEMRPHLADYYATISHLDHEVGRILDTVAERGWSDSTVVIFSSDQGLAVGGCHGLMGKQNLYEHVKPPLVIAGPGIPHGRSDAQVRSRIRQNSGYSAARPEFWRIRLHAPSYRSTVFNAAWAAW